MLDKYLKDDYVTTNKYDAKLSKDDCDNEGTHSHLESGWGRIKLLTDNEKEY